MTQETTSTPEEEAPLAGVRAALGEPHQALRGELVALLTEAGATVEATGDLAELVRLATAGRPTVVVTAERYPEAAEETGQTVAPAITQIRGQERPPTVLVYATSDSYVLSTLLIKAGAEQVRVKAECSPVDLLDDIADAHRFSAARR